MRKQYHSRVVGADRYIWDIHRLARISKELRALSIPLSDIAEVDENWWYIDQNVLPTPRSVANHMVLVQQTDRTHPIILCSEGKLMDGMHRVVKALIEEREHILAVRFPVTPKPDFMNVPVEDLPYPDEEI